MSTLLSTRITRRTLSTMLCGVPVLTSSIASTASAHAQSPSMVPPEDGVHLGFNLDWSIDSVQSVNARLGVQASSFVDFFSFPFSEADRAHLGKFLDQVNAVRGVAVVTLEPVVPLESITPDMAAALADELGAYNWRGNRILVRFAHEMNGSWYPWGQQPAAYVAAFRTIAAEVHARAPQTEMLWAPNSGDGYPFTGGEFGAKPDSADFMMLDSNQDGLLNHSDDPYAPYYPGDDAVDWVGMSLYHWGRAYPWGDNVIPESGKFANMLTGSAYGSAEDGRVRPDFYAAYAVSRNKPLAIVETAALYLPGGGGDEEFAIKQAWWKQVFSEEILHQFPMIRMINWFEWQKQEAEVDWRLVDWTVTSDPVMASAFRKDLPIQFLNTEARETGHQTK